MIVELELRHNSHFAEIGSELTIPRSLKYPHPTHPLLISHHFRDSIKSRATDKGQINHVPRSKGATSSQVTAIIADAPASSMHVQFRLQLFSALGASPAQKILEFTETGE